MLMRQLPIELCLSLLYARSNSFAVERTPCNLVVCLQLLGVCLGLYKEQPSVTMDGPGASDVPGRRLGAASLIFEPPVPQHFTVLLWE